MTLIIYYDMCKVSHFLCLLEFKQEIYVYSFNFEHMWLY